MFELIYLVSIFLFFGVANLITTYGYTTKDGGYGRPDVKVPMLRMSAMPLPGCS